MKTKKQIRNDFRYSVFSRDNNRCVICGFTKDLDAHHITDRNEMPNGGYVKENGITLCQEHHLMAEMWHSTNHEEFMAGMHPDDLYRYINSSYELATKKSKELN